MNRATHHPDTASINPAKPRLILVDDNIRDRGGHYFELASLLLDGAERLGYQCVLGTNRDFDQVRVDGRSWQVHRVFGTRRMVRWSLGVDGHSKVARDLDGRPIGGNAMANLATRARDMVGPTDKRPGQMIAQCQGRVKTRD